jgi:GNAT superfamily N-acetyltransferase
MEKSEIFRPIVNKPKLVHKVLPEYPETARLARIQDVVVKNAHRGRGIGREIVRALAWLGARVVIAELADSGQEVERLVQEAGGAARQQHTRLAARPSPAAWCRYRRYRWRRRL